MRTMLKWLLVLIANLLAAELAAAAFFAYQTGELYYLRERPAAAAEAAERDRPLWLIHPYLGYTGAPRRPASDYLNAEQIARLAAPDPDPDWADITSNNFGFGSRHDYPYNGSGPDSFVIGVFGGSLAGLFAIQAGDSLARRLTASGPLAGREVVVLNFGSGGYRQPQQLLFLGYLLDLGQKLDLVLNIDGFNEVALGRLNWQAGVDVAMPSIQHLQGLGLMAEATVDETALEYRWRLLDTKRRIERIRSEMAASPLALGHLGLGLYARHLERRRAEVLAEPPPSGETSLMFLQASRSADEEAALERSARLWAEGSLLMRDLAASRGSAYLHGLQPNQYVSARDFAPAERERAINPRSPYLAGARAGYPKLLAASERLRQADVPFVSLVDLFDGVAAPVYADDCCHLNQTGNELLAERLAQLITALLRG